VDVFASEHVAHLDQGNPRARSSRRTGSVKQRIENHQPIGFQGFAMNMRRPPFDDLRVREAMAYLLDRETMNQTIMYNQYFLHRSYFRTSIPRSTPAPTGFTSSTSRRPARS